MFALLLALSAQTASAPPKVWPTHEQEVVLKNFRFRDGESLPTVRIVNAVMILLVPGGDGHQFLRPQFADELYGPGQPLDIRKYWIILPDNIGHGKSSKPSDGLRMKFPKYDYDDMVEAQHSMLQALGVKHLRLIFGTSM